MSARQRIGIATALAAVLVSGATACAPSPNDVPDGAAGGGGLAVREVLSGTSMSFSVPLLARSGGFYEKEGLAMEYLPAPESSSTAALNLVVTGQADVSCMTPDTVLGANAAGRDIEIFATVLLGIPHGLTLRNDVVARLAQQGVTPESSLAERIAALRGLSLASTGAGTGLYATAAQILQTAGLEIGTDVEFRPTPDHATAANAARAGQVDGYMAPIPERLIGVSEQWGQIWINFSEMSELGLTDFPWIECATTPAFAQSNPEALEAYTRGLHAAVEAVKSDPGTASDTLQANFFADMDPALFDAAFEAIIPYASGSLVPTEAGFNVVLNTYNATAEIPIRDRSFEDFHDTSFAERAQA